MEIRKTIKSNIIYYYIAAIVYLLLIIASNYIFPVDATGYTSLNFYIILPVICILMGFFAGGARSYAKWGFPFYTGLLGFFLSVLVYDYENLWFVFASFGASLAGVIIRHVICINRRNRA